jgi:hypothetical protein
MALLSRCAYPFQALDERSVPHRANLGQRLAPTICILSGMTKIAIVTGSDSGIGKHAVALARSGFDIGITWHEDEAGAETTSAEVRSHARRALIRHLDLANLPRRPIAYFDRLGMVRLS